MNRIFSFDISGVEAKAGSRRRKDRGGLKRAPMEDSHSGRSPAVLEIKSQNERESTKPLGCTLSNESRYIDP